ncbi:hypothetical protein DSM106972_016000 [Dulcicalothrix desertica PCC 7102]|uniref:MurNAc-LAA domain-containing protein n=1 Tax=Dulcicalothrix desertica PCC 7102 TaxID=232991 RepID=A0A433VQX9_9CYAN|nr:N-acetylmuramoyl-L-alanine amidase [Dulcicalothrix desertica]RUT08432.1 hypothetical protein DSM106972_016000 [Dulcicalothrix desertica PCC 7102]TWH40297.1 N-acetylmuramoyl-L-alanine amidase [Dulcicalothrix desertica PCC 7102]
MTTYAIDLGHGCNFDGGAVGILKEENVINVVGRLVINKLLQLGHEVIEVRPVTANSTRHSLQQRCNTANAFKADVFVSIHANKHKGQAHGTEVFAISTKGRALAAKVLRNICSLGFFSRGVKNGSHLFVLKNTAMVAILIELFFLDSTKDVALYNAEKLATAIVEGLTAA